MLAGAASVLGPAHCALLGGHSGEGQQAALGFSVVRPAPACRCRFDAAVVKDNCALVSESTLLSCVLMLSPFLSVMFGQLD